MSRSVILRAATHNDIGVIADMGARFFEEAGWSDVMTWDDASFRATLDHMIASEDGILLVAMISDQIVGMAAGLVHPAYFNLNHKTGQELFWWVEPAHRGAAGMVLLDALEDQAMMRGCVSWSMIALDKVRWEAVGRLYKRRGYRASEHSYIKALV